jgi:diguanylate cyclase (GGDEF)-like protein/PAS domain S-box-containing protein
MASMPHLRQARLSRLLDRSIRASTLLVVLLTLAGTGTAAGLLWAQQRVSESFEVIVTNDALADQVQSMRLRMGAWVLRGDEQARDDWKRLVQQASLTAGALRRMPGPKGQGPLVDAVASRLGERISAGVPLLALQPGDSPAREASAAVLVGREYQGHATELVNAIVALSSFQRDELDSLRGRQRLILTIAGTSLAVLVLWSVLTLRRSRKTARTLVRELREAFETIDRNRAELVAFTDATPLAVFHLDPAGLPIRLNAKASLWAGANAGTALTAAMRDAVHADDRARVETAWQALVEGGLRFDEVFRLVAGDGSRLWTRAHAVPVRNNSVTTGFVAVMQDITGERQLQHKLAQSRARMRRMTDTVPALMARLDGAETYRFVNQTYTAWFGDAAPAVGTTLRGFLGETAYANLKPAFERVRAGQAVRLETHHSNLHGRSFVGDVTYTPEFDSEGRYCGFYVLVTDITDRKRLEESLFAAKELAQVTLDSIGDAVITTDERGFVTHLNQCAEALLPNAEHARGLPIDDLLVLSNEDGDRIDTSLMRAIDEQRVVTVTHPLTLSLPDGSSIHVEDVAAPIRGRGGDIVGGVLVLRDVSVTRAVAERMRQLAESDALTGLPNRLVFDQRLRDALSGLRDGEPLAVLYMDLDGFKAVNDVHGHGAGDELLRQIAHAFATLVGRADTVCRLGGDEFVALLAAPVSTREALALATRFVDAARRPFLWAGHTMSVTLSVGVAVAPRDGREPLGLLRAADGALYVAKHSGKNRVCVAEPSDQPRMA